MSNVQGLDIVHGQACMCISALWYTAMSSIEFLWLVAKCMFVLWLIGFGMLSSCNEIHVHIPNQLIFKLVGTNFDVKMFVR